MIALQTAKSRQAPTKAKRLFDGAFGQHLDHSTALHLNLYTGGQFDTDKAIAQFADLAQQAALGDDFIAFGKCVNHGFVLFGLLHLWADHHKIQHHKHQHQWQHAHQAGLHIAASGSSGGGLGHGRGNKHG